MGLISQHQISTFSAPVNGTSPVDANTVRGNDNTVKTAYNAHDADTTIHLQNGLVSSRPAASTAGQMWLAADTGAVYAYLDTGSVWVEVNYMRNTGGTITGNVAVTGTLTVTSASASAFTVGLNGATNPALAVDASTASSATGITIKSAAATGGVAIIVRSSGTDENLTLDAKGAGTVTINGVGTGNIVMARLTSFSAGLTVASGQTATLTGATVAGAPTWSSAQTFPNVTAGVGLFARTFANTTPISVSTATLILSSGDASTAGVVHVYGSSGGAFFLDKIVYVSGVSPVVKESTTLSGSPAARTYAWSSGVTLAMASGTYAVTPLATVMA